MLEKREVELETLHHSLREQREEYEKLMHMKLDLELALKHHGLDYTTIQYDVHDWSPSHHHRSSTPKGTPIRRRPLRDMDHSNKKRKTEHPSSADGSFLADEAAYVSAEGGGSASFATESGGQSGCVISESYTIDESTSRQQTRHGQTNGTSGSDDQLPMVEARAVDVPGLSGPRRVLTASGEYVVASATSTVRHRGKVGDTAMGMTFDQTTTTVRAEDRPGLSGPKRVLTASGEYVMEDQTTTTTVTTEDRSGLSGPTRVLTASGEYVVMTSSSEDQATTTTVTAEDRPGLSGPKRVLTASGEYVVVTSSSEDQTTTTTVQAEDSPGLSGPKRVLTASGEYVLMSSEDHTTTSTVIAEDRPGLSGPKRVLTASGEYVVMSSEDQTTTATTVQAEDRPGLSGPKRVLTASGEYVVEDQTTTTTVTAEDRSGLSGPKRVLTASGEYVVVTSSSEHQTTTTTKGGVSTEQAKRVAGAREAGTGGYLGTDDVDGARVTSGGYVVESFTEQRVREGGEGRQKYSMGVTETTTTKKRRSKKGTGHAEGSKSSYRLHQETQTDQDEIDASSAKSGWWRFFSRQSTTSSTTHSSQSAQRDVTSHSASGMTQLGSNSWGKTVRRETTLMRGVDETDTTAVSTSAVTSTESNITSGSKTTEEKKGAYLVDGSGKASRTCFSRIGRLCVWLLPLLFLLLLLFFLLSSLLPGGMLGMFLGWERGSCHLQNSFRQSWRFMLKHRSPPPI